MLVVVELVALEALAALVLERKLVEVQAVAVALVQLVLAPPDQVQQEVMEVMELAEELQIQLELL